MYRRLERFAALTNQPLERWIVHTLSSSLPPLPEDLPPASRAALQAVEGLSDDELWKLTRTRLSEDDYSRLTELREIRRNRTLSADEQSALDELLAAADLLTLQKAYAAVLLKWRGHRLPPVSTLDDDGE